MANSFLCTVSRFSVAAVLATAMGCGDGSPFPAGSAPAKASAGDATSPANRRKVVELTAAAKEHVRQNLEMNRKQFLRVRVLNEGPTGFSYDMRFDNRIDANRDYLHDDDGILTVVDKSSALFLEGAKIDWQTTVDGREGFVFDNPNALK
jgi:iron-sulfur cluster assembly accessory protein